MTHRRKSTGVHQLQNHNNLLDLGTKLDTIATNTANINVNVGDVEINTQDLETLVTATNTKLDTFSGHTNNTTAIGDGSTQLRTVPLGYDRANGKAVSFLVSSAGKQQVESVISSSALPSGAATSSNQTTTQGKLDTQIGHLSDIKANTGTVDGCVAANKMNVNISSGNISGFALESTLTDAEGHLGNIDGKITACNTGAVTVSSSALPSGAATSSNQTTTQGKLDTQIVHLSEIEGAVETIEACVASSKVNVNISSGNISGFSTSALQTTLINDLADVITDTGNIVTGLNTLEASLTSMEGKQDLQTALQTNIQNAVQLIDNAVDGNYLNVNQNVAGNDVAVNSGNKGSTVPRVCIATDDIPIALVNNKLDHLSDNLDTLESSLAAMEGKQDLQTALQTNIQNAVQLIDNAVDGNYLNVNQNVAGADVAVNSGNKGSTVPRVCIATDDIPIALVNNKLDHLSDNLDTLESSLAAMEGKQDTGIVHLSEIEGAVETIEACVGSNKVNVNISSGNISGFSTSALQTTLINDLADVITDTGNIVTGLNTLEASLTSMEGKQDLQTALQTNIQNAVQLLDDVVLAEDTAHGTGNKGIMSLAVRKDTQASLAGTDGDYVPLQTNATGGLRVEASVSKTTVHRTTQRDLATRGSHADWTVDTGTDANFISFYIDFIDQFDSGDANLQVQYSQASNYANPIVVYQGSGTTITNYNHDGSTFKRGFIELKNPARFVRLFNDNGLSVLPVEGGIIIHGRE